MYIPILSEEERKGVEFSDRSIFFPFNYEEELCKKQAYKIICWIEDGFDKFIVSGNSSVAFINWLNEINKELS